MKNIYKYLIVIIILIVILVSIITYRYELIDKMSLLRETNYFSIEDGFVIENLNEIKVSKINESNLQSPLNKMYKAEDEQADLFSLSYGNADLEVGDTLTQIDKPIASDALYMIFRKSYPTVSLEEMGVESVEQAYQVKQLAIWEVAWRTGESKYGSELSFVDSVRNDMNLQNDTIFKKAKDFISYIENFNANEDENITILPTLVIDNDNVRSVYNDGGYIIGPYYYQVESGDVIDCTVTLTDMNENFINAKTVERNGMEKTSFNPGEPFYIKTFEEEKNMQIKIKVSAKHMMPTIYEAENGDDYIVNTYIVDNFDTTLQVEWGD